MGELYGVRILPGKAVGYFFKKEQQPREEMLWASWAGQGIWMEVDGRGGQWHFLALVYCHTGHKCSPLHPRAEDGTGCLVGGLIQEPALHPHSGLGLRLIPGARISLPLSDLCIYLSR